MGQAADKALEPLTLVVTLIVAATVAVAVTVIVGVLRLRHPQAVEMAEH